jgi:hypothetical protein
MAESRGNWKPPVGFFSLRLGFEIIFKEDRIINPVVVII